jgi:hypothetical protein
MSSLDEVGTTCRVLQTQHHHLNVSFDILKLGDRFFPNIGISKLGSAQERKRTRTNFILKNNSVFMEVTELTKEEFMDEQI